MKKFRYTLLMCKIIDVLADDLDEAQDRAAQEPITGKDFVVLEHQRIIGTTKPRRTPYQQN